MGARKEGRRQSRRATLPAEVNANRLGVLLNSRLKQKPVKNGIPVT
jgi:hypothetical protein